MPFYPDPHGEKLNQWHAKSHEDAIDPSQKIIDAHHHLWDYPTLGDYGDEVSTHCRYTGDELVADIKLSGHNIINTVFVECMSMYNASGGPQATVGEVEYVQATAAMSNAGYWGESRPLCGGIIGHVDLRMGAAVREPLEAMMTVRNFRGIRHSHNWDANEDVPVSHNPNAAEMLGSPEFREGFAVLDELGLVFDSWGWFTQLDELAELADSFPNTTIIINHLGAPLGVGPYSSHANGINPDWQRYIVEIAKRPNVMIKLGGAGLAVLNFGFSGFDKASPSSLQLANAWLPTFKILIDAFGCERGIFESNFPVDKISASYGNTWNAFQRICQSLELSQLQKDQLFYQNAARVYRIAV